MSDYIFLTNVGNEIINSIYLSKFVPNRRSESNIEIKYKVGVYTQNIDSIKWEKIDEVEFNESNNIVLTSADYNLNVGQLAVIIPCDIGLDLKDNYVVV